MKAKIDVTLTPRGDIAKRKAKNLILKAVQSKMGLTKQYEDDSYSLWWMSVLRPCPKDSNFEHHYVTKWNARNDHKAIINGSESEVRIQFETPGDASTLLWYLERVAFTVEGTLLDTWGTPYTWCNEEGWLLIKEINNDGSKTKSKQSIN